MKAKANVRVWHPGTSSRTASHIEDPDKPDTCCCKLELGEWQGGQILHTGEEVPDYIAAKCRGAAKKAGLVG